MAKDKGPILVHRGDEQEERPLQKGRSALHSVRVLLLLIGLGLLGYYGYTLGNQYVYQAYENWAFNRQIADGTPVRFIDYLREQALLGWVLGPPAPPSAPVHKPFGLETQAPPPEPGSVLGRVEIPRLHLGAIVREGVDTDTLGNAVGHVPSTALAGREGNFAIAAHRDTLFRALKDIQKGDLVDFQAPDGVFTYRISSLRIVKPSEVSVLRPDGGFRSGQFENVSYRPGSSRLITLITCYPFYYVGSAPKRFIVQGELVSTSQAGQQQAAVSQEAPKKPPPTASRVGQKVNSRKPRILRGFSHLEALQHSARPGAQPTRKRSFWKRLLHRS
jgi:sortase A